MDFRLYVILDFALCRTLAKDIAETARQIISGGADILQLRIKDDTDLKALDTAADIVGLAKRSGVPLIVNDRADWVLSLDADGLHLGQEDQQIEQARKIIGGQKLIGLSCHKRSQAVAAENRGADYIGIGPVFPTTTKPGRDTLSEQAITEIRDTIAIPFVAIGGINLDNLELLLKLGLRRFALCSAIINTASAYAATAEFRKRIWQ